MKISIVLLGLLSLITAKLVVYNPTSLRKKINKSTGEIKSSVANFGHTPYGHSIIGNVWYDKENMDGCGDFKINITGEGDPDTTASPIVLVKRGNCAFVKKSRNVEHAGGALAIIVDDREKDIVERIIMVDDGTGSGINIPSLLIGMKDGDKIFKQLERCEEEEQEGACVQLLAQFEMPHPDDRVEYDFWYTSSNEEAIDFLVEWQEFHYKYKKDVYFTPRIVSLGCEGCEDEFKQVHCFGDGKYCAHHFGNPRHKGQDIIYENLRQKCLHDKLQKKGDEKIWWDYIHDVHRNCMRDITEDCSKNGMKKIGVDYSEIMDCVNDSFDHSDHASSDNRILKKETEDWKNHGPHFFPAVIINNVTYRGFLTPENVFQAICEGFQKHPSECKTIGDSESHQVINGISTQTLVFIVVGIILCNLVLLFFYRRYYKKEMQNEVKMAAHSAVSQYFAIQQNDREEMSLQQPGV